ncbi:MAG: class I SAM-dependent methyltransferase [Geminicoccaceae bacterium]
MTDQEPSTPPRELAENGHFHGECPDLDSSTPAYAARFASRAGTWFLDVQTRILVEFMRPWSKASVLDVGGGHAQVAKPLLSAGHKVTLLATSLQAVGMALDLPLDVRIGELCAPPTEEGEFDVAIALRIMPHVENWRALIDGLCRSAREAVIIDFPIPGGANALAPFLFTAKKRFEGNTRHFRTMEKEEVIEAFRENGFVVDAAVGQFVVPMVAHRAINRPGISRVIEFVCRLLRLDRYIGSPVLMRARRIE